MKILVVHNRYGKFSGEESVVDAQVRLLLDNNHKVIRFERSSAEINSVFEKFKAFFTGIYNVASARQMKLLLKKLRPDIVHIHNLFPFISPSILPECRKAGVPLVMTVHNYRLICPNGLHMIYGKICEKCSEGGEWWCVLRNCERSYFKSIGYALRNYIARALRLFHNNLTMYVCLTEFQRRRLISAGFPSSRIDVVPNMRSFSIESYSSPNEGKYVAYVGRISEEKGVLSFVEAARTLSNISFKIAGTGPLVTSLSMKSSNCELVGFLKKNKLVEFYKKSRFIVFPSIWYETFGLTIVEAMLHSRPVIASKIGGIPDIVDDGVTGLLFEPGDADDLVRKIKKLYENPDLCRQMGQAGREKALREYSSEKYYSRLMDVYKKALNSCSS